MAGFVAGEGAGGSSGRRRTARRKKRQARRARSQRRPLCCGLEHPQQPLPAPPATTARPPALTCGPVQLGQGNTVLPHALQSFAARAHPLHRNEREGNVWAGREGGCAEGGPALHSTSECNHLLLCR